MASIDFETYSESGYILDSTTKTVSGVNAQGKGGLQVVGTPVYAEHPSTRVLCLYYDLRDAKGVRGWIPGTPAPIELLEQVQDDSEIRGWNVTFEFYIWNLVCTRMFGWPTLEIEQCRCDMAKSRRYSLPGGLDNAAKVLGTFRKGPKGTSLIRQLCLPHSFTKKRQYFRETPATNLPAFLNIYSYCAQDIISEDSASVMIPELTAYEQSLWELDQRINVRGVLVDIPALSAALNILEQAERRYTLELVQLTDGAVGSASEVKKLREWLTKLYIHVPDLKKQTVSELLQQKLDSTARRALEIRELLGSANVKKLRKISYQVSRDGRLRNQYMYCGADRTGRWSSAAADDNASNSQLQNITARGPKSYECESCEKTFAVLTDNKCPRCGSFMFHAVSDWGVTQAQHAIKDILTRDLDLIVGIWGDPLQVLCGCLRALFIAKPDHDLICSDFSAIEAVVAACISGCQWRIAVFSGQEDIYLLSASKLTGTPLSVYKQYLIDHGVNHPDRKKKGKIAELASGFGGWINSWRVFGAEGTDEEIKRDILNWRAASPEIVDMWGGQFRWFGPGKWDYKAELFGLEGCAIKAVMFPGQACTYRDVSYLYNKTADVMYCTLPSGRQLNYHRPELTPAQDKLNRGPAVALSFEGWNSNPINGPKGWGRIGTYGGKLFENVVQAIGRDILAAAMLRAEQKGYPIVMHTHDELCAEVSKDFGSVEELNAILSECPAWAYWWPIKAAGWRHERYQKD